MKEARLLDTDAQLSVEHFMEELARSRQAALLLDYDGTLAPFQAERKRAFPYPTVSALLQSIMNTGRTRVVLVTGRRADEVVPLLGLFPHPEIWGAQGLQRLRPDGTFDMPDVEERVLRALDDAAQWLNQLQLGHLAEFKPGSLAVHWRGVQNPMAASIRSRVMLGWLPIAVRAQMILLEFDGGVEIRMSGHNKGDAVRTILTEMHVATPVAYLGDDQTDEDAFRALQNRGLRVLVRPAWRETAADVWLRPPEKLIEFLSQWLNACQEPQSTPVAHHNDDC
jgi:trehalose 6-phosphate phosphatase